MCTVQCPRAVLAVGLQGFIEGETLVSVLTSSMEMNGSPNAGPAWKNGLQTSLGQCEAYCQQILNAMQSDILNVPSLGDDEEFRDDGHSKSTVCIPFAWSKHR